MNFRTEKQLQKAILQEKAKGVSDLEIGQKYGVTLKYIEQLITRSQGVNVSVLNASKKIETLHPKDFKEEQTTVWSFRQRGNWATHSGEYRGNWSPYIPRNVILKYSKPGEIVLDYFCGAGTTAVEAKLLGRKCIALDINNKAIELAKKSVDFCISSQQQIYEPQVLVGDARDLSFLQDNSIDLVCAHPPYANIIHYTDFKKGDLSFFDIKEFLEEMSRVARESFRVLKPGRQCAILIGDTRRKKHVIPLGFKLINVYLNAGFKLKDLIIKRQHNCKTTGFWYENSIKYNFLLLAHEYLPIFEKPQILSPSIMRERAVSYERISPVLKKPSYKRKLKELETTTVWILPEKNFEEYVNKNVINRYSNKKGYSITFFTSRSNEREISRILRRKQRDKGLLFIKSPFLESSPSRLNTESYLQKMKEIVNRELPAITDGGFIVIQTQDVRINGYVEPVAKRVIDMLSLDKLWLKEIIVATHNGYLRTQNLSNYLKTVHQYLLVYEIKK